MRISNFEYLEPQSVQGACQLLSEYDGAAKIIAGGTDLLVMMKQRVCTPQYLINIKKIKDLDSIKYDEVDGLRIGCLTTLNAIAGHGLVQKHYKALSQGAASVASPNIRNLATIGGNLCLDAKCWYYNQSPLFRKGRDADYKSGGNICYVVKKGKSCYALVTADTIPALIALNAEATIASKDGRHSVPVDKFFTGLGDPPNVLGSGEMVAEIHIPVSSPNTFSAFLKESFRGSIEFGIANVAVALTFNPSDGICKAARIALSSVTCAPVNAQKAARLLEGKKIDAELAAEAAKAAVSEAGPISSIWTSVYHRRNVIQSLVKKAIIQTIDEASQ